MVAIENIEAAIGQIAQTTLRSVVGRHTLDELLSETEGINQNIREILDVQTEESGVKVTVVELGSFLAREKQAAGELLATPDGPASENGAMATSSTSSTPGVDDAR